MNTRKIKFDIIEYFCKKVPVKVEELLRETNKLDWKLQEKNNLEQARKDLSLETNENKFLVSYKLPENWIVNINLDINKDLEIELTEKDIIELAYIEVRTKYVEKYTNYHKNMIKKTKKYIFENQIPNERLDLDYQFGVLIRMIE